jgi:hypothetical protein
VLGEQALCAVAVAPPQGLHDLAVLRMVARRGVAVVERERPAAEEILPVGLREPDEARAVRGFGQQVVKRIVERGAFLERGAVEGGEGAVAGRVERGQFLGGDATRRQIGRVALHALAEAVDLLELLLGVPHDDPARGGEIDQALVFQLGEGFADRRPADAQHLRQFRLDEALSGLELLLEDRPPERPVGLNRNRLSALDPLMKTRVGHGIRYTACEARTLPRFPRVEPGRTRHPGAWCAAI